MFRLIIPLLTILIAYLIMRRCYKKLVPQIEKENGGLDAFFVEDNTGKLLAQIAMFVPFVNIVIALGLWLYLRNELGKSIF